MLDLEQSRGAPNPDNGHAEPPPRLEPTAPERASGPRDHRGRRHLPVHDGYGRSVDDEFIRGEVARGAWRPTVVLPEVSGLHRPMTIHLARRKADTIIKWAWHGDEHTFCPPTWADIALGSGACGFACRSCFLMLTFRAMRDPLAPVVYDNAADFQREVAKWLCATKWKVEGKGWRLRTGKDGIGAGIDSSDSLLWEGVTGQVRELIPLFTSSTSNPLGNPLILLTKSANTHYLAQIPDALLRRIDGRVPNVAVTMSVNPEQIADLWEGKFPDTLERITPPIDMRLAKLREAQDMGFEVRLRVDPIMTPDGWEEMYRSFFNDVAHRFGLRPTMITLGSHREKFPQLDTWRAKWGLPTLEWEAETTAKREGTHHHMVGRERVYGAVRDMIGVAFGGTAHLPWTSLCKETHQVRKETGLVNGNCNCLPQTAAPKRRLELYPSSPTNVRLAPIAVAPEAPASAADTHPPAAETSTVEAETADEVDSCDLEPEFDSAAGEHDGGPVDDAGGGDYIGVDPEDSVGLEAELEALMGRLATDMSELATILVLPRAKKIYETLHPETKHGGDHRQVPPSGTCSFVTFVAKRAGIAASTVYSHLTKAEDLEGLDAEAAEGCYGTPLANKVGALIRIAKLPKSEIQRDLVNLWSRNQKEAQRELSRWEGEFKISRPKRAKARAPHKTAESEESALGKTPTTDGPGEEVDVGPAASVLNNIMRALRVDAAEACVPEIERLHAGATTPPDQEDMGTLQARIHDLQAALHDAERRREQAEAGLRLYQGTPLAQLFGVLGASTAKEALDKAEALVGASDGAE